MKSNLLGWFLQISNTRKDLIFTPEFYTALIFEKKKSLVSTEFPHNSNI